MAIDTIEIREKIIKVIDVSDGIANVPFFDKTPFTKMGYRIIDEFLKIENLEIKTFVYSLPPVEFPTFELTASDSEIQLQTLNIEWLSPRIHLNLLISQDNVNWIRIEVVSMLNSAPMPYREFNLGDFELGNNAMLGFQVNNVGYGTLSGSDQIIVVGNLVRKISLEKIKEGFPYQFSITNEAIMILDQNSEREGYTIFNSGEDNIFLDITGTVSENDYMIKIPPQGFYESALNQTSAIWVVSEGLTIVNVREFI